MMTFSVFCNSVICDKALDPASGGSAGAGGISWVMEDAGMAIVTGVKYGDSSV